MLGYVTDPSAPAGIVRREVPEPQPGPHDVLVEVGAFAVNRGELSLIQQRSSGWAPGQDVAGVVVAAAGDGTHAAKRPRRLHRDLVTAGAQRPDDRLAHPRLDVHYARMRQAGIERGRHVPGMKRGEIDGLLQVHSEMNMIEKEPDSPLILLITAGHRYCHYRTVFVENECRAKCDSRTLARCNTVGYGLQFLLTHSSRSFFRLYHFPKGHCHICPPVHSCFDGIVYSITHTFYALR